jgi:type IV pilus assembly protein PilA
VTQDNPAPPPPPPVALPYPYPVPAQPTSVRRPTWFWIAIIGGCFAVLFALLIIAAVFVPQILSVKKRADEASAMTTIRTITTAEISYNLSYPSDGYACSLAALGGDATSGAPTAQAAQLIDPALAATGQKAGYAFTVTCGNKVTADGHNTYSSYQVTGVPVALGKTGDRGFCSNQNNDLLIDPAGGTNCTQPLQ